MQSRSSLVIFFLVLFFLAPGCSIAPSNSTPRKISEVRPTPTGLQRMNFTISRDRLTNALESSRGSGNLRVVPIVTSAAQAPATPEYRLFNIRQGSVGALLGLQNADVLIAANEYVVRDPRQFYGYLEALRTESSALIEVRRDNQPILMQYTFSDR